MEVEARPRSIGGVFRSLGRHKKAAAAVAVAGLLVGLWAWWATQLWGLPDIGDPFDVEAFEKVDVPDDRNAFHWYRDASAKAKSAAGRLRMQKKDGARYETYDTDLSKAGPAWHDLLAESTEALAAWRAGSERPEARYDHPEGLSFQTLLPITQELRGLGRLGILEGSRLENAGDLPGAWGWYRAALRASRHSGSHGFPIERLVGAANHDDASKAITRWAANPKVDAPLLRRALDEVIAIDAMTVARSETLKLEYLVFLHELSNPKILEEMLTFRNQGDPGDWCQDLPVSDAVKRPIHHARVIVANDQERSRRLARLLMASWLVEFDKLPHRRSKMTRVDPPIFEPDPAAPPSTRALPPEELSRWLDSSLIASRFFRSLGVYTPAIDKERGRQARMVVHLASELYRREHGGQAPPSPRALVGPYLEALPDGFVPAAEPPSHNGLLPL